MIRAVRSPAKINLWLEVLRKRADRYHDLSTLMLPIAVYDEIEMELRPGGGIHLICDDPQLPADKENLAWKAADRFFEEVRSTNSAWIQLRKRIPVAAGLGGGSGDAALVLRVLNEMHGEPLTRKRLHELATGLGADVPFFLQQRPALATGIGEVLQPVLGVPDYPIVLITPPLKISTVWVYQSLTLTRGSSSINLKDFLDQPWQLAQVMQNDLEQVTLQKYPVLVEIKDWLLAQGARGALMSGSGPTMFGIFCEEEQAARVGENAADRWGSCWVKVSRTLGRGVPYEASPEGWKMQGGA
ncbi:MAG: 4-(cytidine 5'-diphospho)-2-C-methyl-D-erythritol kinase [Deltaproteobacteria bacterium]|nr:4-(cytidine 5'-diphospho)-2-C-methyl-D-erythritol kinase [Deltaproteobacteria bacterium]